MSTGGAATTAEQAARQAAVNARSAEFAGLLDITGPNKQQYARQHGYSYVDASDLLDNSRPASWSKIPAVLSVLDEYDWIFWLDADTLITNLTLPVEALLPPLELAGSGSTSAPDLLLTADSTGVNAGVWLMRGRGCAWCRSFLELWWSQESFIRRGAHETKSGDNDALKYLVAHMDRAELAAHVGLAPQCAFNSYLWRPSLRNYLRYIINTRHVLTGLWQPGDFVMHAAGIHNKMAVLQRFIRTNGLAVTVSSQLAPRIASRRTSPLQPGGRGKAHAGAGSLAADEDIGRSIASVEDENGGSDAAAHSGAVTPSAADVARKKSVLNGVGLRVDGRELLRSEPALEASSGSGRTRTRAGKGGGSEVLSTVPRTAVGDGALRDSPVGEQTQGSSGLVPSSRGHRQAGRPGSGFRKSGSLPSSVSVKASPLGGTGSIGDRSRSRRRKGRNVGGRRGGSGLGTDK